MQLMPGLLDLCSFLEAQGLPRQVCAAAITASCYQVWVQVCCLHFHIALFVLFVCLLVSQISHAQSVGDQEPFGTLGSLSGCPVDTCGQYVVRHQLQQLSFSAGALSRAMWTQVSSIFMTTTSH